MRIGLSQIRSPSDAAESLALHGAEAARAAELGCGFVLFPELSITGYEPEIAERRALDPASGFLDPLSRVSAERSITIAAGAPLRAGGGVEIGLVVFHPDGSRSDYAKRLLHSDEEAYFVPGDRDLDLPVGGHEIAVGICYEALQPSFGAAAVERGATLFAASVAKHAEGMADAHRYLGAFAARHAMPVVIVNGVGPSGGFVCSGGSAAWRADGTLIHTLGADEGLLVVDL